MIALYLSGGEVRRVEGVDLHSNGTVITRRRVEEKGVWEMESVYPPGEVVEIDPGNSDRSIHSGMTENVEFKFRVEAE